MANEPVQPKPPYLPWTSFCNITDELKGKGLPGKLDRTAIQGKSGSTQAHYLNALRFFGMLDAEDRPTDRYKAYVGNGDQRKSMMAEILQENYAEALALGSSSTSAQLTAQFREYGLEGETGRKAIAFFLNAARFAGVGPLSPYWPQTRPGGGGRRRSTNGAPKPRKRSRAKPPVNEQQIPAPPATDAKSRYVDLLLKKAEDEFSPELLDRIEKVIGVGDHPAESSTSARATSPGGPDENGGAEDQD